MAEAARYKSRGLHLLAHAENFTHLRHTLIHGSLSGYLKDQNLLVFGIVKPDRSRAFHEVGQSAVKLDDLENAADYSAQLAKSMEELAGKLMDEFGQD